MTDMVEMEFRDGFRWVPRYIAMKMTDIEDTVILTYADALKVADRMELEGYVKRAQERLIAGHFRVNRYG
jgi:hypothetical protein